MEELRGRLRGVEPEEPEGEPATLLPKLICTCEDPSIAHLCPLHGRPTAVVLPRGVEVVQEGTKLIFHVATTLTPDAIEEIRRWVEGRFSTGLSQAEVETFAALPPSEGIKPGELFTGLRVPTPPTPALPGLPDVSLPEVDLDAVTDAMKKAGELAKETGMSFKDVAGAMVALTRAGIRSEDIKTVGGKMAEFTAEALTAVERETGIGVAPAGEIEPEGPSGRGSPFKDHVSVSDKVEVELL